MKLRMNSADIAAEASCVSSRVEGMRLANVYDLNAKTYLLKLARSGGESGESEKVFLLLESGIRFHTTKFAREKSDTPSNFTLKLRKHIRTKRIEYLRQIGVDRAIDIQFGTGEVAHHLILELFAHGNIILTDSNYHILTLLRSHRDDDKGVAIMANRPYPLQLMRRLSPLEFSSLKEFLGMQSEVQGSTKKTRLKDRLAKLLPYGPTVCEHCVLKAGMQSNTVLDSTAPLGEEQLESLYQAIKSFEDWLVAIKVDIPKGYILTKGQKGSKLMNDDFCPLVFAQYAARDVLEFESFDVCLDEYFSTIESQKAEVANEQIKNQAFSKLTKVKQDHSMRMGNLAKEADLAERKAEMIEYCLEDVDSAISAVNHVLRAGMPWHEVQALIKDERDAGNPVASLIHSLELEKNQITLILSNTLDDADEEEMARPAMKVEVDLSMNAHANATAYYGNKKARISKQEKTLASSGKALQAAEEKAKEHMAMAKRAASIQLMRKVHWFEKFNWFITSENFLVLSGRDAQQNEILVKRYLRKGDLYVHADFHGASTCIVKNPRASEGCNVTPLSLSQAGTYCVCRSQAWDAKVVTSAWWVHHHQVSKTAPTGEYLTTGSFMIRGKKNYLPPTPIVMGFGFLFRLDEQSLGNHVGERRIRGMEMDPEFEESNKEVLDKHQDVLETGIAIEEKDDKGQNGQSTANGAQDSLTAMTPSFKLHESNGGHDALIEHSQASSVDCRGIEETHSNPGESTGKKRLTAKERRLLKKGKQIFDFKEERLEEDEEKLSPALVSGESNTIPRDSTVVASDKSIPKQVRGKKGKMKKRKDKYADQDEEEREVAMQVLQSSKVEEKHEPKPRELDSMEDVDVGPQPDELHDQLQDLGLESTVRHETRAERKAKIRMEKMAEKSEIDAILAEENVTVLDEDDKEKITEIDALTACPKPDDVLLYSIPFCGPYSSMSSFKYKVKLTPGSQKKGKAAKMAREVLLRGSEVTPREKELMRAVTDPELVQTMIGNVQISTPGLQKIKRSVKESKKSNKKNGT